MAKKFLFHWIPPYSKRAIRFDCESQYVVIVRDVALNAFTSTFQMRVDGERLFVGKIATDPQFEGQGIGKANMGFMESFALNHGCKSVKLDVYIRSERAIKFYERNGYSIIGTKRSVRFKEYIMEKSLV